MSWKKLWIILCLMFIAAGILAVVAGGLLFAYNQ
jgi:hypothetical protein